MQKAVKTFLKKLLPRLDNIYKMKMDGGVVLLLYCSLAVASISVIQRTIPSAASENQVSDQHALLLFHLFIVRSCSTGFVRMFFPVGT